MEITSYKKALLFVTTLVILIVYVLLEQNGHLELTYATGESQEDCKDETKQPYQAHKKHDGQVQYLQDATPRWPKRHSKYYVTSSGKSERSTKIDVKNGKEVQRKKEKNYTRAVKDDRNHTALTFSEYSGNYVKEHGKPKVQMKDTNHELGEKTARDDVQLSSITDQSTSNYNDVNGISTSNDKDMTDLSISDDSNIPDQSTSNEEAKTISSTLANMADNDILHASDEEKNYLLEHNRRIEHMKKVCNYREILQKCVYRGQSSKLMYISKAYNFSYCKVPKSGCTFWTQIFLILRNFSTLDVFGLKRFQVHQYWRLFAMPPNDSKKYTTRMILVSRDPYSRLYSAFIDKAFLGILPSLCNRIRNQNVSVCSHNVTFEEFLRFIIYRVKNKRVLNRHWAPIFSLCEPCKVNQYRLVKQESFSKDVDFILKELQVDPIKYEKITKALHEHRVEITVQSIFDTVFKVHSKQTMLTRCIGLLGVAKRLWTSFKIQGYIDERIDFPESQFTNEADFHNQSLMAHVILNTIKNNPLTSLERKRQRQHALVSAYKEMSAETIEDIKAIYKPDFVLFGYDTSQPSL